MMMDDQEKKRSFKSNVAITINETWASKWYLKCGVVEQMCVLYRDTTLSAETFPRRF